MQKLLYCQKSRVPTASLHTLVDGDFIRIGRNIYQRITSRPINRKVIQRLLNEEKQERIVIYG